MNKALIITTVFLGLVFCLYACGARDRKKLYETVKADFADKHPGYEFIDCRVGEGDLAVAYVHINFKKPEDDNIQEEVWQYWDMDTAWLHREKYLELTNKIIK